MILTVLLHVTPGATGPRCELRRWTGGAWRTVAGHDLPDTGGPGVPDDPGEHLARLLLRADTRRAWEELRVANPGGMRTLVQIDPSELQELHWDGMPLAGTSFPEPRHPVVRARGLGRDDTHGGARLVLPLRLLAVVGEPGAAQDVERAIAATGGRIDAEVLVAPTAGELRTVHARMRPHVLHAIGRDHALTGALPAPLPRLVVLDEDAGWERVAALLDARACAVFTVPRDTAVVAELYRALTDAEPVDLAVARAGLPAGLTVRVPPDQVLPFDRLPATDAWRHNRPTSPDPERTKGERA